MIPLRKGLINQAGINSFVKETLIDKVESDVRFGQIMDPEFVNVAVSSKYAPNSPEKRLANLYIQLFNEMAPLVKTNTLQENFPFIHAKLWNSRRL